MEDTIQDLSLLVHDCIEILLVHCDFRRLTDWSYSPGSQLSTPLGTPGY